MSKQATLFSSWGQPKPSPQDHPPDEFDDGDLGLTEQDLEELCKMEEEATTPQTSGSFHVGPSHAFLNSSIVEEGIPGFDEEAGQLWMFPTNYPLRDYQYNIVHKALFTNTLVCLPTGLGKTFIAAVVMYNFYRWYPNGKIVFLAPTKPLVTQQIEACHNVMGIPQEHTAEMTGNLSPKIRVSLWRQKRVFFLTPQVMQNDLIKDTCPALDVCCVVFDEAHKALGNHAYCQVVKELAKTKVRFRVLALSATPGNDLRAVQQVVTNLQIGHIELRSEESMDIQRYVNERKVEKIVVPLDGEIMDVKRSFVMILTGVLSRLVKCGVFYQSAPDRLSKYQLLHSREQFRAAGPPAGVLAGAVEGDFAVAISLFHAYELLLAHGMRSFYQFLATTFTAGGTQSRAKGDIVRGSQFRSIMRTLGERVAASKGAANVPDGPSFPRRDGAGKRECVPERNFFYSHPKLRRLEDVVIDHFRQCQSDPNVHTRVMIFSQYRDSVQEIADMLERHAPLVRVMTFVGHSTGKSSSKGLSQREQTEIVRRFREGGYNTLVATCVGEEGLDIGDVDLIVCFDAPKSPIRLVQRMGRTGRKRKGRIVMIVAEGKEDQGYNKSQSNKKSIHRAICNGCKSLTFYQLCHRMVPKHIHPQVHKMHMSVGEFVGSKKDTKDAKTRKPASNHGMVKQRANGKKVKKGSYLNDEELNCWSEGLSLTDREFTAVKKSVRSCFSPSPLLCLASDKTRSNRRKSANTSLNVSRTTATFSLGLDKWVNHQVSNTHSKIVHSSQRSEKFVSTLEFIDLLRTSEGMGESYDLEMRTYLDATSINATPGNDGTERTPTSLPNDSPVPVKKKCKSRKRAQFIDDSDSEGGGEVSGGHTSTEKSVSLENAICDSDNRTADQDTSGSTSSHNSRCESSTVNSTNSLMNSDTPLTQSRHVVPRAPSEDDLAWLDDLEPSQASSGFSFSRGCSFIQQEQSEASSLDFCEADSDCEAFDFDTPDLPVYSARKSRLPPGKSSTPASAFKVPTTTIRETPIGKTQKDKSCDIFNDLSAHSIFDDFSTSCIEDNTSRSPKLTLNKQRTPQRSPIVAGTVQSEGGRSDVIVLSDSDDTDHNDVHIIEESDLEEQDEENQATAGSDTVSKTTLSNDSEREKAYSNVPKPLSKSHFKEDTPNSNEDSFLNVRKCRKRPRNAFLQSPDTPASVKGHVSPGIPLSKSPFKEETPNHEESFLNVRKCRKRPRNAFLQSPDTPATSTPGTTVSPGSKENRPLNIGSTTPNISRCKKRLKVTFDCDSSGDEFDTRPPKHAKWKSTRTKAQNDVPTASNNSGEKYSDFVEEEAEVSDDGYQEADSVLLGDSQYDCDDSFINDNSMLTQLSPSQRITKTPVKKKVSKSDANSNNFYLRSLMSPEDHLFATKRRGCGSKYRMVFSQRHELLNHYINKAGFKVNQTKRKRHKRDFEDAELFEADSSGSEAEEVYGLEECSEPSESTSESRQNISECEPAPVKKRTRRAAFLSDSDPSLLEDDGGHPSNESMGQSVATKQVKDSASDDVISPSLLASIVIRRTPACFSLGMDDWIDWDDLSD